MNRNYLLKLVAANREPTDSKASKISYKIGKKNQAHDNVIAVIGGPYRALDAEKKNTVKWHGVWLWLKSLGYQCMAHK